MRERIYEIVLKGVAVVIFVLFILPPLIIVAVFLGYKRTVAMKISSEHRQMLKHLAFQQGVLKNSWRGWDSHILPANFVEYNKRVSWKRGNVHTRYLSPPAPAWRLFRRRCLN